MLTCATQAREYSQQKEIHLPGFGSRYVLDVPATHLTEHCIDFKYDFPLGAASAKNYTLKLTSLDWQQFFWYDEQKWTIENTLSLLAGSCLRGQ